eukprot:gnl/Trimastix_PCT/4433.p1 GENE.gnl/Trimastix_PCT/4433~~gnl/Trimastix_PCT/4433.p1  ORF type:complete len:169 (+),score=28.19 gnl/Trimastix_PCT/4433:180-686(+)
MMCVGFLRFFFAWLVTGLMGVAVSMGSSMLYMNCPCYKDAYATMGALMRDATDPLMGLMLIHPFVIAFFMICMQIHFQRTSMMAQKLVEKDDTLKCCGKCCLSCPFRAGITMSIYNLAGLLVTYAGFKIPLIVPCCWTAQGTLTNIIMSLVSYWFIKRAPCFCQAKQD